MHSSQSKTSSVSWHISKNSSNTHCWAQIMHTKLVSLQHWAQMMHTKLVSLQHWAQIMHTKRVTVALSTDNAHKNIVSLQHWAQMMHTKLVSLQHWAQMMHTKLVSLQHARDCLVKRSAIGFYNEASSDRRCRLNLFCFTATLLMTG
jgi:hypothetical protein